MFGGLAYRILPCLVQEEKYEVWVVETWFLQWCSTSFGDMGTSRLSLHSPQVSLIMSRGAGPEFGPLWLCSLPGLCWFCFDFPPIREDVGTWTSNPLETQVRLTKYPGLQRMLSSPHVSGQTSTVLCPLARCQHMWTLSPWNVAHPNWDMLCQF